MKNAGQTVNDAAHPRIRARLLRVALAAASAFLLLPALSAQAAVTHPFVESFGSFTSPESVAIDQASGEIYVLDQGTGAVSRFNADGTPSAFSASAPYVAGNQLTGTTDGGFSFLGEIENQIAVAPPGSPGGTAGNVYVLDPPNAVEVFADTGEYLGRIDEAGGAGFAYSCGLAVAPDGTLYVGEYGGGAISKFVPSADPPTNADYDSKITGLGGICNIAAGSDTVYASVWKTGPLTAYPASLFPGGGGSQDASAAGTLVEAGGAPITSFTATVDPATDDLYVTEGDAVAQLDKDGALLGRSGTGVLTQAYGLAVRSSTNELFVSDRTNGVVNLFGPPAPLQDAETKGVTDNEDGVSATVHGAVNPNGVATTYQFEYGTTTDYGATAPASPGDAGEGTVEVEVSAGLTGLEPDTTYHYRLVTTSANGTARGRDATFTTPGQPAISWVYVDGVDQTSARLNVELTAKGLPTSYRFDYGPTTAYGSTVPVPSGSAGSSHEPVRRSASITGLQPGTTYHYRVTVANGAGEDVSDDYELRTDPIPAEAPDDCPNSALRAEQHATHLPDCRAYELVSPADKKGANVVVNPSRTRVSATESAALPRALMFASLGGFADPRGSGIAFDYLAQRTGVPGTQGWQTHAVTPYQEPMSLQEIAAGARDPLYVGDASEDLTKAVFRAFSPLGPAPNTAAIENFYVRSDLRAPGKGSYQLMSDAFAPVEPDNERFTSHQLPFLVGASEDQSTILFESMYQFTADAPPASEELGKAYISIDGKVSFLGQVPASGTSCLGTECVPTDREVRTGKNRLAAQHTLNVLSRDGTHAFFTLEGDADPDDLFLRDLGSPATEEDDRTVQINASERTLPASEPKNAEFWNASRDGSRAFFVTEEQLTDDAQVDFSKLYMWSEQADSNGDHLTLISTDESAVDGEAGGVQGVIGLSDDGDTVYYLQSGQSAAGGPELGNGLGIYAWTEGGDITFIGQMVDTGDDVGAATGFGGLPDQLGARVSPDGGHLLISLKYAPWPDGADHGDCPGAGIEVDGRVGCKQLYLYDLVEGDQPICVSCDPSGAPPTGPSRYHERSGGGAAQTTAHLNRPMSTDGQRVFFSTRDSLLPDDTNGKADAYMWEAVGKGSCDEMQVNGGCLSLLSSGTSPEDSFFVEASPDGSDAFFVTSEPLSGWDFDGTRDIYDARIDGGFPEPLRRPAPCAGDSCRGQAPAVPPTNSAGSASLNAPPDRGAKRPKRCAKGKRLVIRGGKTKCVRKARKGGSVVKKKQRDAKAGRGTSR